MKTNLTKYEYIGIGWTSEEYIGNDGPLGALRIVYRGDSYNNVRRRILRDLNREYTDDAIILQHQDDGTYEVVWDIRGCWKYDPFFGIRCEYPYRPLWAFDAEYERLGRDMEEYLEMLAHCRRGK